MLSNRGQLYALAGEHKLAADDFTAALAIRPDDPASRLSRGQALARLGQHVEAIADFTRAIEISPGNAFAYLERGTSHSASRDLDAALADLTRATQLNPFLWLALSRRAAVHVRLGQADRAVADLSEALRLDPLNPGLYAARGEVPGRRGSAAGLLDLDEAVRLDPGNPEWRARRGIVCLGSDRPEQAEQDLTEALRTVPDHVPWLLARGEARIQLNQLDPAMSDFVEASRLAPADGAAYLGQAIVYVTRGDHGMAIAYLDRALGFSPDLAEAHYQRARCNHRMEQIEDAVEDATKSLDLDPSAVLPRRLRAELYLRLGRAEDSYADIAQLVSRAPNDPIVYHLRGKLEFRRARFDAAVTDLTTALKLNPQFTEALADRAGVYRAMSRHKDALGDLTSAVHQDPKYAAEYLVQLGIVRGAMGEFNGAIADFIVALQLDPSNKAAIRGKELVTQLRDSHGSPEADSEERDLDRKADVERAVGGAESKRPRLWRSTAQPDRIPASPAAAAGSAAAASSMPPAASPPSTALMLRGHGPGPTPAGTSPPGLVGVVLEPEPDVEYGPEPAEEEDSSTEFELEGGFAEQPEPDDLLDLEPSDVEEDEPIRAKTRKPAARRGPAKPRKPTRRGSGEKSLATSRAEAAEEAERARKELEAEKERQRLADLTARAEAIRRQNEEEEKKRRANRKEDPEERAARKKRQRNYAIIAVGALFLGYYAYVGIMALLPPPDNPFDTYTAEEFVGKYAKDSAEADDKFADKRVAIKGKLKIVREKNTKAGPGKIYLDAPGELKVELQFAGDDATDNLKEQTDYLINGKATRFKGQGLVLKECNIMGGQ